MRIMKISKEMAAKIPLDVVENIISFIPYNPQKLDKWSWFVFFLLSDMKFPTIFFTIDS